MNKKILTIIGVVFGISLSVLLFFLLRSVNIQEPVPNLGSGTTIPVFPTVPSRAGFGNSISIKTQNGGSMRTKDFLNDSDTVEDSVNEGHYYLGNNFGENNTQSPPYVIEFTDTADIFMIGLFQEPIAQSRKKAEQYLMEHLGISQSQMCELQYMVTVPADINEFYSGQNLGFSFCPGSVQIPE